MYVKWCKDFRPINSKIRDETIHQSVWSSLSASDIDL